MYPYVNNRRFKDEKITENYLFIFLLRLYLSFFSSLTSNRCSLFDNETNIRLLSSRERARGRQPQMYVSCLIAWKMMMVYSLSRLHHRTVNKCTFLLLLLLDEKKRAIRTFLNHLEFHRIVRNRL